MGLFESIVVVYLRKIYYPQGFGFPLAAFDMKMLSIEILREACTLVMLLAITFIAGNSGYQRLAWFLLSFGVWDITYYVGLKWLLDWPSSLLTWDILFLIPITWIGPVLAPVICSVTMIGFASCILILQHRKYVVKMEIVEWAGIIAGSLLIFYSVIRDFLLIIIKGGYLLKLNTLGSDKQFVAAIYQFVPDHYRWDIFIAGECLIVLTIIVICIRAVNKDCMKQLTGYKTNT
jgi:hypothetical protein